MNRVVVIGGGASGMTAAIASAEAGAEVILLEHNDRLGKKINATGNGKCNLGNASLKPGDYRGGDENFVKQVFACMSPTEVREWFNSRGLLMKEKKGYFYPRSEQAASVNTFFFSRLMKAGVTIICSSEVQKVKKSNKGYFTVTFKNLVKDSVESVNCDNVVLSTGGMAGQNLGAGPFGYETAKSFGHLITPLFPALVQLVAKDKNLKILSGVRAEAAVHLFTSLSEEVKQYDEIGEILFTDYGISGIAVMQLSRYAADALRQGGTVRLSLDFFSEYDMKQFTTYISDSCIASGYMSVEDAFCTLLPKKLLYVILLRTGIAADRSCRSLSKEDIDRFCLCMKQFVLPIVSTKDFAMAQVTAGGVSVSAINPNTMESELQKKLYITGELLDVDGTCGGYNLQFAFATGILAGEADAKSE